MRVLSLLVLAGAFGTLARYGLGGLVQRIAGPGFPYGTLVINLLGCTAIGLVMHLGLNTNILPATARASLAIGFLGAFTTFSAFSYETVKLLESGAWLSAAANIGANVGLGILATIAGLVVGRVIIGGV